MNNENFTSGSGNSFIDLGFNEDIAANLTIKACLFNIL